MEILGAYSKYVSGDRILNILQELRNKDVVPDRKNVFKAFWVTPDPQLIIIGQDPYPQRGVATGLAFANWNGDNPSPSLELIVDRLAIDYKMSAEECNNFDYTLESWAKQGVLLLNSSLTCEVNKPGSHTGLWYPFMVEFLQNYTEVNPGTVFMLFGEQAKLLKPYINMGVILEYKHPAYYARINESFDCDGFIRVNKILKEKYNTKINWYGRETCEEEIGDCPFGCPY